MIKLLKLICHKKTIRMIQFVLAYCQGEHRNSSSKAKMKSTNVAFFSIHTFIPFHHLRNLTNNLKYIFAFKVSHTFPTSFNNSCKLFQNRTLFIWGNSVFSNWGLVAMKSRLKANFSLNMYFYCVNLIPRNNNWVL